MSFGNRLKSFGCYIFNKNASGKPYRLVIEITNACNLKCRMCPRNIMERKVQHMNKDLFEEVLSVNYKNIEFVGLNGYGEPLLHPDIIEYINICRKYEVASGISTNCTRLDNEMSEKLLKASPNILTLAIDSVSKESYEQVRTGATFEKMIKNVTSFLKMRESISSKSFVILQCIYMTETKDQIRKFYRYFRKYKYNAVRIRQLTYSGRNRNDADYKNKQMPCYWLWTEPMILSDGTLVACCQDINGELALGNIKDKTINNMWENGYISELREKHLKGRRDSIPICKSCNMYQPNYMLAMGASIFNTSTVNKCVPLIESTISHIRYHNKTKD